MKHFGWQLCFFFLIIQATYAQIDSLKKFTFSGYGELYYGYDFSNPANHERPSFLYNHKRHNELNFNLVMAKASYNTNEIRANLGLMFGNYAEYNLAAEPTWASFIYEANAGVKLSKMKNIWLDTGIIPSHIGFESAIGADCWTLTRSILAENSPYYETGVKGSYMSDNQKFNVSLLYLNGWQRIRKPDGIQKPSMGLQLNYKANTKLTINYSNFIGTDKPDSLRALRVFHNLYAIYEPNAKIGFITGFDFGTERRAGYWLSPVLILRYWASPKLILAFRTEYYQDKKQIIITTNTRNGFDVMGYSLNLDYQIYPNVKWRTEFKNYTSRNDMIFNVGKTQTNYNNTITSSLSFRF